MLINVFLFAFTDHKFDCDNVKYYSGEHKCKVEGIMAGTANAAESESVKGNTICTFFRIQFFNICRLLNDDFPNIF